MVVAEVSEAESALLQILQLVIIVVEVVWHSSRIPWMQTLSKDRVDSKNDIIGLDAMLLCWRVG